MCLDADFNFAPNYSSSWEFSLNPLSKLDLSKNGFVVGNDQYNKRGPRYCHIVRKKIYLCFTYFKLLNCQSLSTFQFYDLSLVLCDWDLREARFASEARDLLSTIQALWAWTSRGQSEFGPLHQFRHIRIHSALEQTSMVDLCCCSQMSMRNHFCPTIKDLITGSSRNVVGWSCKMLLLCPI